ncbi:hypothetical protein HPB49_003084 [Dermacentor silvarum]|uniref:Uncharacterized protein n=1 Tax=Dermacentor silvarum TaxID=543639 RepID=A0ACB8DMN9_DERSI|nr:hypothetical protein HPB49_003084 [Dermacentor silvarum]
MELLQDQLEEKNLTPVHVVRRHVSPQNIIMRLGPKLNLAKYPTYQVTNAIGVAAGLTASEVLDVNIQVRQLQNLVAVTSGWESATQKLAGLRSMTHDGERHHVTAYVAAEAQHAHCVVHGLPKDIPDDQLLSIISIEDRQILAARRLGQHNLFALVLCSVPFVSPLTTAPMCVPRLMNSLVVRHVDSSSLPPNDPTEQRTNGPHRARDPRCPKKQQADKLTRLATEIRRLKTTTKNSGQAQNRQTSQSIATNPPKKNDQNYTSLPLHNRFEALRYTTPDPKPEPKPRSGSLPGYSTKRSTPPQPSSKPKTPSFVRALLSQKPPAHSEEPPQKQPRHSSPAKVGANAEGTGKIHHQQGSFRAKAREETQRLIGAFPIEQRSQDRGTIPEAAVSSDELEGLVAGSEVNAVTEESGGFPALEFVADCEGQDENNKATSDSAERAVAPVVDGNSDKREETLVSPLARLFRKQGPTSKASEKFCMLSTAVMELGQMKIDLMTS